jgi:hypothetical protein
MKLPFDFGIKLIFRLLIPGFFLSIGFFPILNTILASVGWTSKFEYVFVILIIFMGWLITFSDMGIYMLFEGRRFWPNPLKRFFSVREEKQLAEIKKKLEDTNNLTVAEAYFDIRNFPMNSEGDYIAFYPSRLGNLLAAFEGYSLRVYGIDAIFYWSRIWLNIDKDTREEIDNSQALADSTVYTSFALFFTGLLWLLYSILTTLQLIIIKLLPSLLTILPSYPVTINQYLPSRPIIWLLSIMFLLSGFIVYRLSLRLQAQFGEIFKSVFDNYEGDLNVSEIIKEIALLTENSPSVCLNKTLSRRDRFGIAARYLQYHRYRCPNPKCNELMKPSEIANHVCKTT